MKKKILSILMTAVLIVSTSIVSYASTQWCTKSGSGSKVYSDSKVTTGWAGTLKGIKNNIFTDDKCIFSGISYSSWLGYSPINADRIVHYDIIEVKGIGSVSFSGGIGASATGVSGNFGVSGTTSSKNQTYAYEVSNKWRVSVDYSYYAEIYSWDWMDLFTAASFKFGSKFVVVNSRVDNPTTSTGKIYYN